MVILFVFGNGWWWVVFLVVVWVLGCGVVGVVRDLGIQGGSLLGFFFVVVWGLFDGLDVCLGVGDLGVFVFWVGFFGFIGFYFNCWWCVELVMVCVYVVL